MVDIEQKLGYGRNTLVSSTLFPESSCSCGSLARPRPLFISICASDELDDKIYQCDSVSSYLLDTLGIWKRVIICYNDLPRCSFKLLALEVRA